MEENNAKAPEIEDHVGKKIKTCVDNKEATEGVHREKMENINEAKEIFKKKNPSQEKEATTTAKKANEKTETKATTKKTAEAAPKATKKNKKTTKKKAHAAITMCVAYSLSRSIETSVS